MRTLAAGDDRAVTQVIGVAVLLGLTVVSLGALTAGIGAVVEETAASADASRVADGLATALEPVERSGHFRAPLAFTGGRIETVERDLRVIDGTRTVRRLRVDALVWTSGESRVAYVAGAILRGRPGRADLHTPPPVTASRGGGDGGVLIVGAPRLGTDAARTVSAGDGTTVPLRTNVTHTRTNLGVSNFRVAIETRVPGPLVPHFREQGAAVTRRDIDDDGIPSVVATYPGQRRAYLVVHDLRLTVGDVDPSTPADTPGSEVGEPTDSADEDGDDDDGDRPVDPPVPGADTPHDGAGERGIGRGASDDGNPRPGADEASSDGNGGEGS